MEQKVAAAIKRQLVPLERDGRMTMTKQFCQHGNYSVYEHCVNVAYMSCIICKKLGIRVSVHELIRGALLHDYFLYDWHTKDALRRLHGFSHPKTAWTNASQDFHLTKIESDIILHHMFPLTIVPPKSREAWIVCAADKICAVMEVFGKVGVEL